MIGTYLDSLRVQLESFPLVDQEFLNILALIPLQLDHLAHLIVGNDCAIAGCLELATTYEHNIGNMGLNHTKFLLDHL